MIRVLLFLPFLNAVSDAFSAGKAVPGALSRETSPKLSWVVKEHTSGWLLEDDATRQMMEKQARRYIELRSGRMDENEREKILESCEARGAELENPFCPALQKQSSRKRTAAEREERRKKRARVALLKSAFKRKDWKSLRDAHESELVAAVRTVEKPSEIRAWSKALLAVEECQGSALPLVVGLKVERLFPDPEARNDAPALYEQAARCGNDTAAVQAFYRLGLLRIWEGRYTEAEVFLGRVVEHPQAQDFRQRALYWRTICAQELKEGGKKREARDRLLREYPLSLHGLLLASDNLFGDLPMVNSKEPEVTYRTRKGSDLNLQVLAAEGLQAMGAFKASLDVLEPLADRIAETEVSFQLYVSILLMRAGDSIKKFGLIAALFRSNPYLISQPTLELLYPLQRFDIVRRQTATSVIDPYLVLSLIRQESAFNERAKSPAGAVGLMQLMPRTARRFERVTRMQLYDPRVNVRVGTKLFERLIQRFEGDVELALAAYNAGPLRVDEWRKRYPIENRLLFLDLVPFRETRDYVASITRNYYWYLRLYSQEQLKNRIEAQQSSRAVLRILGLSGTGGGA